LKLSLEHAANLMVRVECRTTKHVTILVRFTRNKQLQNTHYV